MSTTIPHKSRSAILRILFLGGQAAIAAEVMAVIGIFFVVGLSPTLITTNFGESSIIDSYDDIARHIRDARLYYSLTIALFIVAPTATMLLVVWTWHIYLADAGV